MANTTSNITARDVDKAFCERHEGEANNKAFMEISRKYYGRRLGATEYCTALRSYLRLNPGQAGPVDANANATTSFVSELDRIENDHRQMKEVLQQRVETLDRDLDQVFIWKEGSAAIFTLVAYVLAFNATPLSAAFSVLTCAIGSFIYMFLKKRWKAIKKLKKTAGIMILGAEHITNIKANAKISWSLGNEPVKVEAVIENIETFDSEIKLLKNKLMDIIF